MRALDSLVTLVTERVAVAKDPAKPYVGLEHIPSGGASLKQVGSSADSISTNGVFASGDILFGKLRPRLRKSVRATQAGYCSTDILVLRTLPGVDPCFASFVTQSDEIFRRAIQTEEGTKMPRCSWRDLRTTVVFAPESVGEQQRIAAILTSLDAAIEATEALIEKHQQIKAGLMHDLFTRGVLPNGELRPSIDEAPSLYADSKLGPIPKEWQVTTCEAVCERVIDCKNRTPPETPEGYPVIRTPNVRRGEFMDDELVYTDAKSYEVWTARGKPVAGDIVITREAPVGEVCMIPPRHAMACLGQRMMLYRPDAGRIDATFFLFALQSNAIQSRLDLISGGSTVGHVRVGDIRSLWMYLPSSIEEQQRIGSALSAMTSRLRADNEVLAKLRMQKQGLMQDLLTGKVPVRAD